MATPSEYLDSGEVERLNAFLTSKEDDDPNDAYRRFEHDRQVMLALVYDKAPKPDDKNTYLTRVPEYTHPMTFLSPAVCQTIEALPNLEFPNKYPRLLRATTSWDTTLQLNGGGFQESATREVQSFSQVRPTVASQGFSQLAMDLTDDVIEGHGSDAAYLHNEKLLGKTIEAQVDAIGECARGRSRYRVMRDPTSTRPLADGQHADIADYRRHCHGIRYQSLPPTHNISAPVPSTAVTDGFRRFSENRLMVDVIFKEYGNSEDCFSYADLCRELYKFDKQRGGGGLQLKKANAKALRDYLKHHLHWNVSKKLIESSILRPQSSVPLGILPYTAQYDKAEDTYTAQQAGKLQSTKFKIEKINYKERRAEDKLAAKYALPPRNLHAAIAARLEQPSQNEDVMVRLKIPNQAGVKKYARIEVTVNYIDEKQEGQPRHRADITLTEMNARKANFIHTPGQPDPPFPSGDITLHDVSAPSFIPRLQRLFRHVSSSVLRKIWQSKNAERGMYLFVIPMNKQVWTTNLLTNSPDQHPVLSALADAATESPTIFILARLSLEYVVKIYRDLCSDFEVQTHYNPLVRLYANEKQFYVSKKNMISYKDVEPKFVALVEKTFPDWFEYSTRVGGAIVIDHQLQEENNIYTGRAALVPVSETAVASGGFLAFSVVVALDSMSLKRTKLQPGDAVEMKIDSADGVAQTQSWRAVVVKHCAWTPAGNLSLIAEVPIKSGVIQDTRSVHVLSDNYAHEVSVSDLQKALRGCQRRNVKLTRQVDFKDTKAQLNALQAFNVTRKMNQTGDPMVDILRTQQQFFLGKNLRSLPSKGMLDDLTPENRQRAHAYLDGALLPHQKPIFEQWVQPDGIRNSTGILTGVPGSGKTTTVEHMTYPFCGNVEVNAITLARRNRTLHEFYTQQDKAAEDSVVEEEATFAQDEDYSPPEPIGSNKMIMDRPYFQQPEPGYDPNQKLVERGRITFVAATNDTVNAVCTSLTERAPRATQVLKTGDLLIVRKHSKHTELAAVHSLLHEFELGPADPRTLNDRGKKSKPDTAAAAIYEQYLNCRKASLYRGIFDDRFVNIHQSQAYNVFLLSRGGTALTPGLRSAFSPEELVMLYSHLLPLRDAQSELQDNDGVWTKEMTSAVDKASNVAIDWLDAKAHIVCTTVSAATEYRFSVVRQPHVIVAEEVGRMKDSDLWHFFSNNAECLLRIFSGDWRQLGPQFFTEKKHNPFYFQGTRSLLARSIDFGFSVPELVATRRFGNQEMLKVCQIVSLLNTIEMLPGAERDEDSANIRRINRKIFPRLKVDTTTLFLDVVDSEQSTTQNILSSWSNPTTAIVTSHVIEMLIRNGVRGSTIVSTSAYNASTDLEKSMITARASEVSVAEPEMAEELRAVRFSTIDSFMGEEADHVLVNTSSRMGFLQARERITVMGTRAKIAMYLIGSIESLVETSNVSFDNPLKKLIRSMYRDGWFTPIKSHDIAKMHQYQKTLDAFGFYEQEQVVDFSMVPPATSQHAIDTLFDNVADDPDDVKFRYGLAEVTTQREAERQNFVLDDPPVSADEHEEASSELNGGAGQDPTSGFDADGGFTNSFNADDGFSASFDADGGFTNSFNADDGFSASLDADGGFTNSFNANDGFGASFGHDAEVPSPPCSLELEMEQDPFKNHEHFEDTVSKYHYALLGNHYQESQEISYVNTTYGDDIRHISVTFNINMDVADDIMTMTDHDLSQAMEWSHVLQVKFYLPNRYFVYTELLDLVRQHDGSTNALKAHFAIDIDDTSITHMTVQPPTTGSPVIKPSIPINPSVEWTSSIAASPAIESSVTTSPVVKPSASPITTGPVIEPLTTEPSISIEWTSSIAASPAIESSAIESSVTTSPAVKPSASPITTGPVIEPLTTEDDEVDPTDDERSHATDAGSSSV